MRNWYNIARADGAESGEVLIYDEIGGYGISAAQFARDFKAMDGAKAVTIRINSPGGSVTDGTAIFNLLRSHGGAKTAIIDGMAASMASVIAMAADKIVMPGNALMMIHNPWTYAAGDAEELRKSADLLDKIKGQIVGAYARKTGKTDDEISALMDAVTWMTGDEAKAAGFADEVIDPLKAAAKLDLSRLGVAADPRAVALMEANDASPTPPAPAVEPAPVVAVVPEDVVTALRAEHAEALRTREARILDLTHLSEAIEAKLNASQAKASDLERQLADQRNATASAVAERNDLKARLERLLGGGLNFEPDLTWPDALAKCGNNYAEARKRHPQAYKAFMDAQFNRPTKKQE